MGKELTLLTRDLIDYTPNLIRLECIAPCLLLTSHAL
jgi:hypothetical protein